MKLLSEGFDILCSDLRSVCADETRRLFPGYRFMELDIMTGELPSERFDGVLSCSFAYLLPPDALAEFFRRVAAMLRPGGTFVLDAAGSPDAPIPNLLHNWLLPFETHLIGAVWNIGRVATGRIPVSVRYKHHGYRYRDDELISLAQRAGFVIVAAEHMAFETEWLRSFTYRNVIRHIPGVRQLFCLLGRYAPYVRMFAFQLSNR